MKRLAFAALALAAIVLPAAPAAAHGGGGSDATNFQSRVTAAPDNGLKWSVLAGDSLLEMRNGSGREVVVEGYSDEPYLRFAADGGVFENRRSPATYLNEDRYGRTAPPGDVDAEAPPRWRKIASGNTYAWHDHRIHWMSLDKPPAVQAQPGETVEVQRWSVPYRVGAETAAVTGVLRYVPAPPWWPWIAVAAAVLVIPALVVVARSRRAPSVRRATRTGAALIAVVAAADVVHQVDDLLAVPATAGENLAAGLTGAAFIVAALVAAAFAWRAKRSTFALVIGAAALVIGFGLSHTGALGSSQLATVLPEAFTRIVVAANLAVVLPLALLFVVAESSDTSGKAGAPAPAPA